MPRQTISASLPSALLTLRISRRAAARSAKNCRPNWQYTTSKDPSANGSLSALASCHWSDPVGITDRATLNIPGLRSTPTTTPVGPTPVAAIRATIPVPHATSTTRSPGRGWASSTSIGAHTPNTAGTSSRSYISGALPATCHCPCCVIHASHDRLQDIFIRNQNFPSACREGIIILCN